MPALFFPLQTLAATSTPDVPSATSTYARRDGEFSAALVMDARTKKVLYAYQADLAWPAASLTKLMGALVFLDYRPSWNTIVSIKKQDEVGGGRLRVNSGATMSVRDMLYSSITASANNAATALARITLGRTAFVRAMNRKAAKLGLAETHFVDPSGISPKNVTTARDMAKLALAAFSVDAIRRPATTASYRFKIRNTGEVKTLKSTNDLLIAEAYDDVFVTGGKTGFLYESAYNLAVRLKPLDPAKKLPNLLVVVFGSQTRESSFESARSLATWAWNGYTSSQ